MRDQPGQPDNEELRLFVSATLRAIMAGVADAQESAKVKSAHGTGMWAFNAPRDVAFDIAVQATKTGKAGGGLKLTVFSVGANAEAGVSREDSTISRISFTVPSAFKSNST